MVGSPISHSKSPLLHAAAYDVLGLDWVYSRREVLEHELETFVQGLDSSWRGLSVTMPLKRNAFDLSISHDSAAVETGSVNTLAFSGTANDRVIRGYNTDVYGISQSFTAAGVKNLAHGIVLGGGATAESALVAFSSMEIGAVTVVLRDPTKATRLTDLASRLKVPVQVVSMSNLSSISPAHLVISTVPGEAALNIDDLACPSGAVFLDAAYDVWPSPRAQSWSRRGGVSISGLSMLAFQALKQVRIFASDSPDEPLPNEAAILQAMFASVGLNENGL